MMNTTTATPTTMTTIEISSKLAEVKKLAGMAAGLVPIRKSASSLTHKDAGLLKDLVSRQLQALQSVLEALDNRLEDLSPIDTSAVRFSPNEQDVIDGLVGLKVARSRAEEAVYKASATLGKHVPFDPLFREAMRIL